MSTSKSGKLYLAACEQFDSQSNSWTCCEAMQKARAYAAAAVHAHAMYIFGGLDSSNLELDDAVQFDFVSGKWSALQTKLNAKRCSAAAVCIGKQIFIVGGVQGPAELDLHECFDVDCKQISLAASLTVARSGHAVASLTVNSDRLRQLIKRP